METFELYIDRKVTGWERSAYRIEADSNEEAKQKLLDIYKTGREYDDELNYSEMIYETFAFTKPTSENEVLIELLDEDFNTFYTNLND